MKPIFRNGTKLELTTTGNATLNIFRPYGPERQYKNYIDETKTVTMVLGNKKIDKYFDNIFITRHLANACVNMALHTNLTLDETLVKLTVHYLKHEILHQCIAELEGFEAGSKYDILNGGYSHVNSNKNMCGLKQTSCGGGFKGFDDLLP